MATVLFEEMVLKNPDLYKKVLDMTYYQKIINYSFLMHSDDMMKAEMKRINDWYRKESFKCQMEKEKN